MARRLAGFAPAPPLLFLLLLLLFLPPLQSRSCSPCFWFATPDTVQCRFVELQEPPSDLPSAVRNLTVAGGNLSVLTRASFSGGSESGGSPRRPLLHLTSLVLLRSRIEALQEAAFAGLPSLATLDLSHNPLRFVSPGAFLFCARLQRLSLNGALPSGRPAEELLGWALANLSLVRLEVAGNGLRVLPATWALPVTLQELDARNNSLQAPRPPEGLAAPLLRLQLAGNPLTCDCPALRPLLLWIANASWRVPDRRELRCAGPPPLQDALLLHLGPRQLKCLEEGTVWGTPEPIGATEPKELETVSYIFLGLVLALIGLVFVMVLYLNRRGIKRWLNNLREACRDQMEGYQYRYEQDRDPHRASPGGI